MRSRTPVAAAVTNFNASSITFRGRDGKCLDYCTRRGWSIRCVAELRRIWRKQLQAVVFARATSN